MNTVPSTLTQAYGLQLQLSLNLQLTNYKDLGLESLSPSLYVMHTVVIMYDIIMYDIIMHTSNIINTYYYY